MKIARLRVKVLTQNQKCFENYVIVVYISKKKTFENMPYKCPILLILDLPKNAGTRTGCT